LDCGEKWEEIMSIMKEGGSGISRDFSHPDGIQTGPEEAHCQIKAGGPDGMFREISRRSDISRPGEDRRGDLAPPGGSVYNGMFL